MINLCCKTILGGLTVLTHHDHRSRIRGLKGKRQIQQNERVNIPTPILPECCVEYDPGNKNNTLRNDKGPRTDCICHLICDALTPRHALLFHFVDVAADHTPQNAVVFTQASAQFHQYVNCRSEEHTSELQSHSDLV